MREQTKFLTTLIISIIGALAWLAPFIYSKLTPNKINGKIISVYKNFNKDMTKIFLLFKVSLVSRNKDYYLKDIDLNIKFQSSNFITTTAVNNRLTVFTYDGIPKKLLVPGNEFINNLSVLKKDSPVVGYLLYTLDYSVDEDYDVIEFIFKSYKSKKTKKLTFKNKKDIKSKKLLFDDSIWENIDLKNPIIRNLIDKSIYNKK